MARQDLKLIQIVIGGSSDRQLYGLDAKGQVWMFFDKEVGWIRVSMETREQI